MGISIVLVLGVGPIFSGLPSLNDRAAAERTKAIYIYIARSNLVKLNPKNLPKCEDFSRAKLG